MEISLTTLVGIGLAAMFFGYIFGLVEGRGQGYKRRKKEEAVEGPSTPAPAQTPTASMEGQPAAPADPDKSLLRLRLDENQKPVLEMDGHRADVAGLAPDQRKRLIDLMLVMRPWVEASTPAKPSVPLQPVAPPIASVPASVAPRRDFPAAVPIAGRSPAPVAAPARPVGGREAPEPGVPATMVGQIDAILQTRIAGTPLENRAVRLTESPEGDAIIWIGSECYAGVRDVPDPEVKSAIKGAIAEWEKKYTPS